VDDNLSQTLELGRVSLMDEIIKIGAKYVGEHFSIAFIGTVLFFAGLLYAWHTYLSNNRLKEENES
jgi:hypothetical protein